MELTPEEKQRWKDHRDMYRDNSKRYNPNRSSDQKYLTLVAEYNRLGSINQVMKIHGVARSTVNNAIRFVKRMEDETRTVLPRGIEVEQSTTPCGSTVNC